MTTEIFQQNENEIITVEKAVNFNNITSINLNNVSGQLNHSKQPYFNFNFNNLTN